MSVLGHGSVEGKSGSALWCETREREREDGEEVEQWGRGGCGSLWRRICDAPRGNSCTCPRASVSLTEDAVSVDANASQLGSRPKALSGIEFHQTSFNQQVFKVRITLPLLQPAGQG